MSPWDSTAVPSCATWLVSAEANVTSPVCTLAPSNVTTCQSTYPSVAPSVMLSDKTCVDVSFARTMSSGV